MNRITRIQVVVGICLAIAQCSIAYSAPYVPANGDQILERLPSRNDPSQQELNRLRRQLIATPTNLALAANLARRYIDMARSDADPRYLGYAQAALAPWWSLEDPPAQVRILRATLLQSTHQFQKALADLDAILKADQGNAQAWLTRATVLQVQGDYAQAKTSCAKLYRIAPELILQTCLYNVANLSGQAKTSYESLKQALKNNQDAELGIQVWISTLLAEMAQRSGDNVAAEMHFRKALSLAATDSYLLGAYADFLLDQGRNGEVVDLLKEKTRVDGLLLRYALARQAQDANAAVQQIDSLRARFDAAMLRGDTVHQREQSRFELQLMHNPRRALALAEKNWMIQKEPADASVLLEAAIAARDKAAAQPIVAWLKKTQLQDVALEKMAKIAGQL